MTLDASATSGSGNNGGYVTLYIDKGDFNAPTFVINANGPASGTGNGGMVSITSNVVTLNAEATATVTANGSTASTGNGGSINIQPQTGTTSVLQLGSGPGYFALAALAGQIGGTGGSVQVNNPNGAILVDSAFLVGPAVNVGAAPCATGNAGSISFTSGPLTLEGDGVDLSANGGSTTGNGGIITLNSTDDITTGVGSLAAEALGNGNGGTIDIDANNAAVTNTLQLTTSVVGQGNGGTIDIQAASITAGILYANGGNKGGNGGNITLTGGINANSSASLSVDVLSSAIAANAGTITINGTSTQPVIIGASSLDIDASCLVASSGNAGTITVTNVGPVSVDGNYISAVPCIAAESGSGGVGGSIAITGSQVTVTTGLNVDSTGNNLAGTINLTQTGTTADMVLDDSTLSASGYPPATGSSSGNQINITSTSGLSMDTTTLEANGGGEGSGGNIQITLMGSTPLDLTEGAIINAMGGYNNGNGGMVTINSVSNFDVLDVINVNPDDDSEGTCCAVAAVRPVSGPAVVRPLNTTTFYGEISLNDYGCTQYPASTDGLWPKNYWDCGSPTNSVPESTITQYLTPALRGVSNAKKINIFVFETLNNYALYFDLPNPTGSGITWQAPNNGNIYSSVWEEGLNNNQLAEVTIHEAGHGFDHLFGQINQSASPRYATWVQADLNYLNFVPGGAQRLPCTPTGNIPAPFTNVNWTDQNGAQHPVCVGTTVASQFANDLNSTILEDPTVGKYYFVAKQNDQGNTGFSELYAQALAYEAYSSVAHNYAFNVPDNVFINTYFTCVRSWADTLQMGSSNPAQNPSCGD